MSPERNKNVVQPGTLIVMRESRVHQGIQHGMCDRSLQLGIRPITEDSKEANEQSRPRRTRNKFHVGQDVSNTVTTDRSQDCRGTAGKRSSKVLFVEFIQKQPSGNLLFFSELHQVFHHSPNDKQYQKHPRC